jgi:hypothetical protein
VVRKRKDSKSFILTLNTTSGLPDRVCREWNRRSFQNFPAELVMHYNPKTKGAAEAAAQVMELDGILRAVRRADLDGGGLPASDEARRQQA